MIFHWWLFWKPIFHCFKSHNTLVYFRKPWFTFYFSLYIFLILYPGLKIKKENNLNLNSLKILQKLTFKIRTWYVVFLIVEPPVLCFHIYSWVTFSAKPDQETVLQRPKEREEERAKLRRLQNLRSKDAGEQTGDEAEAATTGEEDYNAAITCSSL